MVSTSFTFESHSFRKVPTPLDTQQIYTYNCIVPVRTIPKAFREWMDVNAREPSLVGHVPNAIRRTLNVSPELFVAYNRGLAILAESIDYDNQAKKVKVSFKDKQKHGVFDGGHTLEVILDERNDDSSNEDTNDQEEAYCRLEIMVGVPMDMITELVDARNTSKQVTSKSLLNLAGRFDEIKSFLGPRISNLIIWKENEEGQYDVRDLIALLTSLDRTHYDDTKHFISAYSGKEQCLNQFKVNRESYSKLYPITKDILKLYETIQAYVPQQYNTESEQQKGKFGKLTGCKPSKRPRTLPVIRDTIKYEFPSAYLYPIVAAFRSMLVEVNGTYTWGKKVDPCKLVRDGLANKIFSGSVVNSIKYYHNPNRTGKDINVWALAYQIAENHFLRIK